MIEEDAGARGAGVAAPARSDGARQRGSRRRAGVSVTVQKLRTSLARGRGRGSPSNRALELACGARGSNCARKNDPLSPNPNTSRHPADGDAGIRVRRFRCVDRPLPAAIEGTASPSYRARSR